MSRGDLADELRALSEKRFRPPGSLITRSYGVSTLERWYYAHRAGGLEALRSKPRSDRGFAQTLTAEQRKLLCDIRQTTPESRCRSSCARWLPMGAFRRVS